MKRSSVYPMLAYLLLFPMILCMVLPLNATEPRASSQTTLKKRIETGNAPPGYAAQSQHIPLDHGSDQPPSWSPEGQSGRPVGQGREIPSLRPEEQIPIRFLESIERGNKLIEALGSQRTEAYKTSHTWLLSERAYERNQAAKRKDWRPDRERVLARPDSPWTHIIDIIDLDPEYSRQIGWKYQPEIRNSHITTEHVEFPDAHFAAQFWYGYPKHGRGNGWFKKRADRVGVIVVDTAEGGIQDDTSAAAEMLAPSSAIQGHRLSSPSSVARLSDLLALEWRAPGKEREHRPTVAPAYIIFTAVSQDAFEMVKYCYTLLNGLTDPIPNSGKRHTFPLGHIKFPALLGTPEGGVVADILLEYFPGYKVLAIDAWSDATVASSRNVYQDSQMTIMFKVQGQVINLGRITRPGAT